MAFCVKINVFCSWPTSAQTTNWFISTQEARAPVEMNVSTHRAIDQEHPTFLGAAARFSETRNDERHQMIPFSQEGTSSCWLFTTVTKVAKAVITYSVPNIHNWILSSITMVFHWGPTVAPTPKLRNKNGDISINGLTLDNLQCFLAVYVYKWIHKWMN